MAEARYDATRNQYVLGNDPAEDIAYTANGAIAHTSGTHGIAKTSAAAMTLSAPTAGEENSRILIVARTAFAHTVTVAGGIGGNAADDVITFAKVGDSIELIADALHWVPTGAPYGAVIS